MGNVLHNVCAWEQGHQADKLFTTVQVLSKAQLISLRGLQVTPVLTIKF